ncbi:protein of unknown function [Taphrina deformans PYCC 5710]|uniref:F-box domain-containing protein n=1 Tax=Taphrina deformans (strain PYCC 5710 / ATCC 11124 / CBS 356.35 / IMI 108563 / JCM 9778 / NBRC 8474) TaxID=1097556 RepID=R4XFF5_TAPDE|nr:protein of unknown function [Taphrina deformans PYCC 5710]|eukprot:CCG84403.1 protein of unknown function [Taphrina deformans PYCC 5710]
MSLAQLPLEILQTIYSFLDEPAPLRACSLTCTSLAIAANSSQVYRFLFLNIFEPRRFLGNEPGDFYYQELKQRWQLLRHPFSVTPDALTTIQNMLFEADSSMLDIGKNMRHLLRARVGDLLEYDLAPNHPEASLRTSARPLFYKLTFLLLSSMLGPLSSWELKYARQTQEGPLMRLDEDLLIILFTYEDLFHNHVTRISETGKPSANIICATPPLDFAGPRHVSSPDWQIFNAVLKVLLHVKHTTFKTLVLDDEIERPLTLLTPTTTADLALRRHSWIGIYVYLDFDTFQWLASEQTGLSTHTFYSDGAQTCNFDLHPDGSVTGDGRGAWARTMGGRFTIHGTWTRIRGCPAGFKRVTFVKRYPDNQSRWLYDGMIVPGANGGLYIGRWKDDTEQMAGELAVQGPFIFTRNPHGEDLPQSSAAFR